MDWFGMIKRYYDGGFWTKEQVAKAVVLGKITADQYQEIVGEPYTS
jgi:uncharacterized XkdX family phage protein